MSLSIRLYFRIDKNERYEGATYFMSDAFARAVVLGPTRVLGGGVGEPFLEFVWCHVDQFIPLPSRLLINAVVFLLCVPASLGNRN